MTKQEEAVTIESIYNASRNEPLIEWSQQHEKILIDWADKASCYKWLHEKTMREFSRKNRWFTIPVIVMSTFTGTANFAQDRIPPSYVGSYTMIIGTISLIAGIITTIQQFLKISELNESHRVSSISWGKFYRNVKIELAKSPPERTPVTQLIKSCKEEFDRLVETSQPIPNHVIVLFKKTFSGGELQYDNKGNLLPLNEKQILFSELTKPEICDSIESVSKIVYKAPPKQTIDRKPTLYIRDDKADENKEMIESFIKSFDQEKKRLPTIEEIQDNIESTVSLDIIESILSDIEIKTKNDIYSSAV
jgi:hypothetical protein